MLFDTLLIANRGEIACRVIDSARALGLKTVAVYSDADVAAVHVAAADVALRLGPAPAAQSYLRADLVIDAALRSGAGAIHPGYGFLSENAEFAQACADAGIVFVGPTPAQLRTFGDKHEARAAAVAAGVPVVAGSGLLADQDQALAAAEAIGYPVMVKAAGGGGGIGMQACHTPDELIEAFTRVQRLAATHFGSSGVFLERFVTHARHVEVQIFGDGNGRTISLGTRDCTIQRRNQKVVEEAPAPNLPAAVTDLLLGSARALGSAVGYRGAGTVEFVYDVERAEASFLEVNTRLQVEHPVTEAITGVDLVAWMLREAGEDLEFAAELAALPDTGPAAAGHAVQARVYAEDPHHDYRPSSGLITAARFPATARVDTWVETGTEVGSHYDPLLAKIIVSGADRASAFAALTDALADTEIHGVRTNLAQLQAISEAAQVRAATHTTALLRDLPVAERRVDVLRAGTMTTVQDHPGRIGLWEVGIPPSGPMDDRSMRLANTAVGNPPGTPALEATLSGPRLRFSVATTVCVTGAPATVTVDDAPVAMWAPTVVPAGGVLDIGVAAGPGLRTYLAVAGGLAAPEYLGSASTFPLGGFGGPTGAALVTGAVLDLDDVAPVGVPASVPVDQRPAMGSVWELAVAEGPQPAPGYFTAEGMDRFYAADWTVQPHADRTGIRLSGPAPVWSRPDGGEAGLHPSNLHDNPYSVGALNVSGDTPILLGPDGPSLGGFACPLTVVSADRWKLGQIRPGDTVKFVPITDDEAAALRAGQSIGSGETADGAQEFATGSDQAAGSVDGVRPDETTSDGTGFPTAAVAAEVSPRSGERVSDAGRLASIPAEGDRPSVAYLRGGDDNVLVEYGDMVLDLGLRMRVHALSQALAAAGQPGVVDITPGVRSLHIHTDPDVLSPRRLVGLLRELEADLPATHDLAVPSRTIRLPLSFGDPSIAEAISRYRSGVRDTAPWLPSNTEFIRRINGLDSVQDVADTMFRAEYLVLGLGDVYLGAPLAVPLDPRDRLVTTKYNPARTWTPSDAVGIGGKYLCVYGMASPGGYQLVGRTVPIWSGYRQRGAFEPGKPWLFRFFDRIVWESVSPEELTEYRAQARAGRYRTDVTDGEFVLADHLRFLADNAESIGAFDARQQEAFQAECQAWRDAGEFDRAPAPPAPRPKSAPTVPAGGAIVEAPMAGHVLRVDVTPGDRVAAGATTVVLEAMKLEMPVQVSMAGQVVDVLVNPGDMVAAGTALLVVAP